MAECDKTPISRDWGFIILQNSDKHHYDKIIFKVIYISKSAFLTKKAVFRVPAIVFID